jgi:hypothetical protein
LVPDAEKLAVQADINDVLEEEGSNWRLTDGQFFLFDSEFIRVNVVARTYELLKASGFDGALDEFNSGRNDLSSGDTKGAVVNACKAFESALKVVLGKDSGNASALIRDFTASDACVDLPGGLAGPFGEAVLMALPFLRNRIGGHGQGDAVVTVSRALSELALNLSACFLQFVVRQHLHVQDGARSLTAEDAPPVPVGDDVPF